MKKKTTLMLALLMCIMAVASNNKTPFKIIDNKIILVVDSCGISMPSKKVASCKRKINGTKVVLKTECLSLSDCSTANEQHNNNGNISNAETLLSANEMIKFDITASAPQQVTLQFPVSNSNTDYTKATFLKPSMLQLTHWQGGKAYTYIIRWPSTIAVRLERIDNTVLRLCPMAANFSFTAKWCKGNQDYAN